MAATQINLRLDDELLARVDAQRGDVPRNRWIQRAVEREVDWHESNERAFTNSAERARPAAERPVRSSTQAKTGVGPRPKGKS